MNLADAFQKLDPAAQQKLLVDIATELVRYAQTQKNTLARPGPTPDQQARDQEKLRSIHQDLINLYS
jgi:hypothetical protein